MKRSKLLPQLLWLAACVLFPTDAAVTAPPPAPVPPPELRTVSPAAIQRGTEQLITITGSNLVDITGVVFSGKGLNAKLEQVPNASTVKLKITAAKDAPVGVQEIRLIGKHGLSNCRYLYVDYLPVIAEKEPNTLPEQAQPLEQLPVAITGVVTGADRDFFRFYAKAGQKLVFQAIGRELLPFLRIDDRIGWFDPALELYRSDGHLVASADDFRYRPDAVLIYEVPADGEYILCVRDTAYRGRGDFVYVLRAGQLPLAVDWFPVGGKAGTELPLKLFGVHLPADVKVKLPAIAERPDVHAFRLPVGDQFSNEIELWVDPFDGIAEKEPNDGPDQAQPLQIGQAVNGTIHARGQSDWFTFDGKKGQVIVVETVARRVGSPLDPYLELYDARGRRLAANDDAVYRAGFPHPADARIRYRLPADGTYRIRLRDTARIGGPDYRYRLQLYLSQPDFELALVPTDPFITNPRLNIAVTIARALPVGGTAYLRVRLSRLDGFGGPVELVVDGLPEGVRFSGGTIAPGQNETYVTLTADEKLTPGTLVRFTLKGKAKVGDREIVRTARPRESHSYIADQRQEYPVRLTAMAAAIAPPIKLTAAATEVKFKPTAKVELTVKVDRPEGAKVPVKLSLLGLPRGYSATAVTVAPDQTEGKLTVTTPKNAAHPVQVVIQGEATVQKKQVMVWSPAIRLVPEQSK